MLERQNSSHFFNPSFPYPGSNPLRALCGDNCNTGVPLSFIFSSLSFMCFAFVPFAFSLSLFLLYCLSFHLSIFTTFLFSSPFLCFSSLHICCFNRIFPSLLTSCSHLFVTCFSLPLLLSAYHCILPSLTLPTLLLSPLCTLSPFPLLCTLVSLFSPSLLL